MSPAPAVSPELVQFFSTGPIISHFGAVAITVFSRLIMCGIFDACLIALSLSMPM